MPAFSVSPPHTARKYQKLTRELQRLVRFLARDGRTYYGDAILPRGVTDISKARQARIVQGDIFGQHHVTDQVADIRMLLAPLAPEDVRTVRCLGLNYAAHAKEVGFIPLPPAAGEGD
jgi:hypothetical protein